MIQSPSQHLNGQQAYFYKDTYRKNTKKACGVFRGFQVSRPEPRYPESFSDFLQ
jgi:hypothetical protein